MDQNQQRLFSRHLQKAEARMQGHCEISPNKNYFRRNVLNDSIRSLLSLALHLTHKPCSRLSGPTIRKELLTLELFTLEHLRTTDATNG